MRTALWIREGKKPLTNNGSDVLDPFGAPLDVVGDRTGGEGADVVVNHAALVLVGRVLLGLSTHADAEESARE